MNSRALRRAIYAPLLALVALLALGSATPARAAAATLVQYGWWTEANYVNGVNGPTDQTPDKADLHASIGPMVYDDPYSLQNDSKTGTTEVSAVMFNLPQAVPTTVDPAAPVANLRLTVDPAYPPAGTVTVLACRTLEGWSAELGGNWTQRASYQSGCAVGVTNDGGKSYDFTVLASQVKGGRTVDMAIAPTLDPTALPFKVWFKPPTGADLTTLALPVAAPDTFGVPQQQADTQITALADTGSGYPVTAFSSGGGALPAPPAAVPPAAAPPAPAAPPAAIPRAATPQLAGARQVLDTGARILAGVLLLAVVLAVMSAAGLDLQRLLTPAGQVGGVGRFRRQRTGPPLPL
ncbi:MAG TPA: hypothetical protein VGQ42_15545 [Candidatus Dormibacteraeota bacterium]|jgi:hypothetical protein|nr:hypothetical protein [Candidatus Dormibacteraeota bacterium]